MYPDIHFSNHRKYEKIDLEIMKAGFSPKTTFRKPDVYNRSIGIVNNYRRKHILRKVSRGEYYEEPKQDVFPVLTIKLLPLRQSLYYESSLKKYSDQLTLLNIKLEAIQMIDTSIS